MNKKISKCIWTVITCLLVISCSRERVWPRYDIMHGDNGKWGYVKLEKGSWLPLSGFIYDDAGEFQPNGVARVMYEGKFALIDRKFKFISDRYSEMSIHVDEDLIFVKMNDKYGFINSEGVEVIEPVYQAVNFFVQSKKYVSVQNDAGKWALLNADNEVVIDFSYNCMIVYRNNYVVTCDGSGRYGALTLDGDPVIPFQYSSVESIKGDKFIVKDNDGKKTAIVGNDNTEVFECYACDIYETTTHTHVRLESDGLQGMVDYEGNVIVKPAYDKLYEEKFGMIVYEKDRQRGLIGLDGKDLLEGNTYELVEVLSEDEVRYFTNGHWEQKKLDALAR